MTYQNWLEDVSRRRKKRRLILSSLLMMMAIASLTAGLLTEEPVATPTLIARDAVQITLTPSVVASALPVIITTSSATPQTPTLSPTVSHTSAASPALSADTVATTTTPGSTAPASTPAETTGFGPTPLTMTATLTPVRFTATPAGPYPLAGRTGEETDTGAKLLVTHTPTSTTLAPADMNVAVQNILTNSVQDTTPTSLDKLSGLPTEVKPTNPTTSTELILMVTPTATSNGPQTIATSELEAQVMTTPEVETLLPITGQPPPLKTGFFILAFILLLLLAGVIAIGQKSRLGG